jgi:hypothetical protein
MPYTHTAKLIALAISIASLTPTSPALASDAAVPHTFVAGTPASAAEVNANFQALVDEINALKAAIGATACGTVDAALDYEVISFGVGIGAANNALYNEAGVIRNDACLKPDGTLQIQGTLDSYTWTFGPLPNGNEAINHSFAEPGNDPEGELGTETLSYTLDTDCSLVVPIPDGGTLKVQMDRGLNMGVGVLTEKNELCSDGSDCASGSGADIGDNYYHELVVLVRKGAAASYCASL